MKQTMKPFLLSAVILLLAGCLGDISNEVDEGRTEYQPNQVDVQTTTNQLANNYYRAAIVDGKYQPSSSASTYYAVNSARNIRALEDGLLRMSQSIFPTDQYFMREGQVLDRETLTSWVGRESATNPEGLNPALPEIESITEETSELNMEEATLEDGSPANDLNEAANLETTTTEVDSQVTDVAPTPVYLSQIMEKNLLVETEEGYSLSGIVIGLAMNSVYEYQDSEGVIHTQEISVGEMRERGRQLANIIVGRLRNSQDLRSVPIAVGIFRNAPNEEIVGGTFLLDGISREGNSVTDWTEINEYRIALPILNPQDGDEQFNYFDNFRQQIVNFFPNLNGIVGEALYINDGLAALHIEIVTQFYQKSEIIALEQHITDVAQSTLPGGIEIEIKITSDVGVEGYVGRPAGATQFESHVFN